MVTKYNTGQPVLIPAIIKSAEEQGGKIIYHVESDPWEGIPEDAIVVNEQAQTQRAMEAFRDALTETARPVFR